MFHLVKYPGLNFLQTLNSWWFDLLIQQHLSLAAAPLVKQAGLRSDSALINHPAQLSLNFEK